jgi:N-acetylglucosamine kinase-like BadF-type ATPase
MSALYIAVDGGNSKTDVVLGRTDGAVLGRVRGPGSSPDNIGLPATVDLIDGLIGEVRRRAGITAPAAAIGVYLAGIDLPIELTRLRRAVERAGWARTQVADNDVFALLRAGTDTPDAVAVVCGAGINAVGRTADGRTARFPALGEISGDWGGGHHLAAQALWYAARGEDGRGERTELSFAVADHFGRRTVADAAAAIHLGEIPRDTVYELTPILFSVASTGDPVAAQLVQRQIDEVLALHRVAAQRLDLLTAPHAVVLGGGVLRARQPLLHHPLLAGLAAAAPLARVSVVTEDPVVGAALLTLDHLGASPSAGAALRDNLDRGALTAAA